MVLSFVSLGDTNSKFLTRVARIILRVIWARFWPNIDVSSSWNVVKEITNLHTCVNRVQMPSYVGSSHRGVDRLEANALEKRYPGKEKQRNHDVETRLAWR
jgi:hypothetical protein